ncbi:MAG: transposase [Rickettsiaceae bacterium]|nr:transposase [Rickettsiaceae bacterium]
MSKGNNIKAKSYSNEFKFKVALELIKGDLTVAEVVSRYQVPRSVASRWKKQLLDNGSELFKASNQPSNNSIDAELEKLHATIGRLKVENDFLQDVSRRLKL